MYRYQELPAAFTRSRLIDLDSDNAVRRQNAEYLTEHLKGMDGIIDTPYIPEDRTSVYHYYRLRFDPRKAGLNMPPKEFRARVQKALIAEGIQAQRWQTRPVQLQTLFQEKPGMEKDARGHVRTAAASGPNMTRRIISRPRKSWMIRW